MHQHLGRLQSLYLTGQTPLDERAAQKALKICKGEVLISAHREGDAGLREPSEESKQTINYLVLTPD